MPLLIPPRKKKMLEFFKGIADKGTPYLIGQIIGLVAIAWSLLIYTQKSRDRILIFKFICDAMSVAQFILCGAYTGAGLNAVMCGREAVFFNRGKHKWADSILWLFAFSALIFAMPFITCKEPVFSFLWVINVLPAIGSCLAVIGLYNKKAYVTRLFSLIGMSLWLTYVIIIENPVSILSNAISIVSILIGLGGDAVRALRQRRWETEEKAKDSAI